MLRSAFHAVLCRAVPCYASSAGSAMRAPERCARRDAMRCLAVQMLMIRILLSVFQFRVSKRYVAADPPFMGIELDISDSGREACAVSTLTITSEPKVREDAR